MSNLKNPECTLCNKIFPKQKIFYIHTKVVHQETDSLRLVRLEETIKSAVKKDSSKNYQCIFDCSECIIVFKTREDQEFHDKKHLANLDVDMSPIKSELMCDECKETFINKSDQVEHMENNHKDNSYSINIQGGGPKSEVDSIHELSSDDWSLSIHHRKSQVLK